MKSKATGFSPSEMLYGTQIKTPRSWIFQEESIDLEEAIIQRIRGIKLELPELRKIGIDRMVKNKNSETARYNEKVTIENFKLGNLVYKLSEQTQRKLEAPWEGPYKIKEVLNKGTYLISDSLGNQDLVHGDRLKLFNRGEFSVPIETIPLRTNLKKLKINTETGANRGRLELKGGGSVI
ncbi:hypothetical protein AYI69_g7056 [Smittium culicis]|uniref:Retrovirus-related Pol polyprotein from transposon n=1 Tax=Smittium culicis TaxID=133412 RepID=A0A1R1XUQ6_9FUNG|nr:hypothetical protein AYI69_g7056 [Smittium culicis]